MSLRIAFDIIDMQANNTASTMTVSKSSTMDFEPTRFTHHRNGSLPIGTIELLQNGLFSRVTSSYSPLNNVQISAKGTQHDLFIS